MRQLRFCGERLSDRCSFCAAMDSKPFPLSGTGFYSPYLVSLQMNNRSKRRASDLYQSHHRKDEKPVGNSRNYQLDY
jgi:hypothetical protein